LSHINIKIVGFHCTLSAGEIDISCRIYKSYGSAYRKIHLTSHSKRGMERGHIIGIIALRKGLGKAQIEKSKGPININVISRNIEQ